MRQKIRDSLRESARVKTQLAEDALEVISEAVELIVRALRAGNKVLFLGNGGSAADAQHLAAELSGRFLMERPALPALSLTTNTCALTAIGNDYGHEMIFVRQLEGLLQKGDVVVALSTSGNSPNVLKAVNRARELGAKSIGLTGEGGGKLNPLVDVLLAMPSHSTPRIQEAHITIGHIICELVERQLFGESR